MPTISQFIAALRAECLVEYDWARRDPVQLEQFMSRTADALRTKRHSFIHDSPCMTRAYRACGFKGRPTWKNLHTLV